MRAVRIPRTGVTFAVPVLAVLLAFEGTAQAEPVPLSHEVAVGVTGVYDSGQDRGLRYGLGYRLSVSMVQVRAQVVFGDTDPRNEQHWAVALGLQPTAELRIESALHHRSYVDSGFGENMVTFMGSLRWQGLVLDAGLALRFPIDDPELIQSPIEFDAEHLENFPLLRAGYLAAVGSGVSLGVEMGNVSRFEIHNFNYPMFAAVTSWSDPVVGTIRADVGFGTAGFFGLGSTIDRGFVRLEYAYATL